MRTRRGASVSDVGLATCRYVFKRLAHACQSVNLHCVLLRSRRSNQIVIRSSDPSRDSREPLAISDRALQAARSGSFAAGTARAVLRARRCSSVLQAGPGLGSGIEDRTQRCRGYGHRDRESAAHAQYLYLLLVFTGFRWCLSPNVNTHYPLRSAWSC